MYNKKQKQKTNSFEFFFFFFWTIMRTNIAPHVDIPTYFREFKEKRKRQQNFVLILLTI